jgi:hypothetical protein
MLGTIYSSSTKNGFYILDGDVEGKVISGNYFSLSSSCNCQWISATYFDRAYAITADGQSYLGRITLASGHVIGGFDSTYFTFYYVNNGQPAATSEKSDYEYLACDYLGPIPTTQLVTTTVDPEIPTTTTQEVTTTVDPEIPTTIPCGRVFFHTQKIVFLFKISY